MVVRFAYITSALLPALLVLSSCGGTVTHRETIPFSRGKVELVITSVGGALGDERYELSFKNGNDTQTFFQGANFSEFAAAQKGSKLAIHLCNGFIDRAEPIGIGQGENYDIVRLDLDWNCADKSRES